MQQERNKRVKKVETTVKSIKKYTIAMAGLMKWKIKNSVMEQTTEQKIESSEDEVEENLENDLLEIWKSLSQPTKKVDMVNG